MHCCFSNKHSLFLRSNIWAPTSSFSKARTIYSLKISILTGMLSFTRKCRQHLCTSVCMTALHAFSKHNASVHTSLGHSLRGGAAVGGPQSISCTSAALGHNQLNTGTPIIPAPSTLQQGVGGWTDGCKQHWMQSTTVVLPSTEGNGQQGHFEPKAQRTYRIHTTDNNMLDHTQREGPPCHPRLMGPTLLAGVVKQLNHSPHQSSLQQAPFGPRSKGALSSPL